MNHSHSFLSPILGHLSFSGFHKDFVFTSWWYTLFTSPILSPSLIYLLPLVLHSLLFLKIPPMWSSFCPFPCLKSIRLCSNFYHIFVEASLSQYFLPHFSQNLWGNWQKRIIGLSVNYSKWRFCCKYNYDYACILHFPWGGAVFDT